ncbi:MAG: nitrite and sulphite reductase 4Fe-4S region [Planctomycetaceae bacterium]|nr:nitrite and sulphite reductase 4Fe-4S region [Planctomycetaceae bacterium]
MKASNAQWKGQLGSQIPNQLGAELDVFEHEIALKQQGKIEDRVFAETRLRRGAYGQRYDNGQRADGKATRTLNYPSTNTKGPGTLWDAPGMQRIKIPFGGLNASRLEMLADLCEEYSDGIAHVTTRQDFQLHYIHIEDTPTIMRRLASVGITTREACGNSVRNVTACPIAGVCREQSFDVTPYARAIAYFMLGHPDAQAFGRKFKIAFSGCKENACGLVRLHDFGAIAVTRKTGGETRRGFELWVGGGLGPVPQQAKLYDEFVPEEEILPVAQAIGRVFAQLGEKKNRNTARLKFLVSKLGIVEFKRLVQAEREILQHDPRWTAYLKDIPTSAELPLKSPALLQIEPVFPHGFERWRATNVYTQLQPGYATVTIALPLGDITASQLRLVADLSRRYVRETIRSTVEQNLVLRWVSEADLPALFTDLERGHLASPVAGTVVDVASCPGTDTCKLGIASSRGLAGELRVRLAEKGAELDESIRGLRIKISGCFNSCGQHHVADLGFYGVSRNKNGYTVPHFQVVLGGEWTNNAGAYGLAIGAVPSKRIPETVDRITGRYVAERAPSETFQAFIKRIGKTECKKMIEEFTAVPRHDEDPSFYSDWGDPREFTLGDIGVGECAGEVIAPIDFELVACEREVFEAQLKLESGDIPQAAAMAYESMLHGALALLRVKHLPVESGADNIVEGFRKHFFDTELFFDPFVRGKFAQDLFKAHENAGQPRTLETTHQLIEEAQLFIEACFSCYARISAAPVMAPA